jgi:hypothetical protein
MFSFAVSRGPLTGYLGPPWLKRCVVEDALGFFKERGLCRLFGNMD